MFEGTHLDPGCPIHGMSAFSRFRQNPEGRSMVERCFVDSQAEQAD
jgi:hypothetical protein